MRRHSALCDADLDVALGWFGACLLIPRGRGLHAMSVALFECPAD
jgi:hypothetical protein